MATFLPGVTDVFPGPAPFEPNFQFIDTMLRRRQSMYEQGYSQVSAAYKALNRNLTNPLNAQSRDGFLRQAEANLKDLSAMDLSLPQNVDAATNVFKPFYQNTDILADMSLTAHWDQQESIANMYRTKDGGKEYSEDNINYVRQQRNKYAQDNPANWRGYMQEKRSYTPYYDWNKEFMDYMKVYKPNSVSIKRRNGMYNVVEENKGATAEDLKLFFSSVASEKAKEQMRISAVVRIGDTAEAVAPYYKQVAEREIGTYTQQLNDLDTQIKVAQNQQTKDQLSEQRKFVEKEIADRKNAVDKIKNGDVEFLRANASKIAFSLYFDDAVGRLAKGLSWQDYKYDFDGDDVAMMYYKNAEDWKRTIFTADRADRRAIFEAETKARAEKEEKEGKIMNPLGYVNAPNFNNATVEATTVSSLQGQIQKNMEDQTNASRLLRKHVANTLGKKPEEVTSRDILTYGRTDAGQRDNIYLGYKQKISEIALQNDLVQRSITAAQNSARKKIGEQAYAQIDRNFKQLDVLGKDKGITGEEMYHAVLNGTARLFTDTPLVTGPNTGMSSRPTQMYLEINGKRMPVKSNDKVVQMYNAAKNYSQKAETRAYNQSFGAEISTQSKVVNTAMVLYPDDKRYKATAGGIGALVGLDATKVNGILYGGKNDAYFTLEGDNIDKNWDSEKKRITERATAMGLEIKVDDATKQFYIKEKPGVSKVSLGLDIYANFTPHEKQMINIGETTAPDGYVSPHFFPGNKLIDAKGTPIKQFHYKVVEEAGQKYFYLYNDAYPSSPIKQGESLTDLFVFANSIADNYTRFLQTINPPQPQSAQRTNQPQGK